MAAGLLGLPSELQMRALAPARLARRRPTLTSSHTSAAALGEARLLGSTGSTAVAAHACPPPLLLLLFLILHFRPRGASPAAGARTRTTRARALRCSTEKACDFGLCPLPAACCRPGAFFAPASIRCAVDSVDIVDSVDSRRLGPVAGCLRRAFGQRGLEHQRRRSTRD